MIISPTTAIIINFVWMNNENHEKLLHLTFRMKIFQYDFGRTSKHLAKMKHKRKEKKREGNRGRERTHLKLILCETGNLWRIIMSFIPIEFTCFCNVCFSKV